MNNLSCTIPQEDNNTIQLSHGGGGRMTQKLISTIFYPAFANEILAQEHDSAQIEIFQDAQTKGGGLINEDMQTTASTSRIAFTTDSFVVSPLFFPGGNIGDLAINGTVNDLLCSGAIPQYLSAAFIIEEGFPISTLRKIVSSMSKAAKSAGVKVVTGDTKVIGRQSDKDTFPQLYINTSGIGLIPCNIDICPKNIKVGDKIIVTGKIGEHGMCIMCERNNLKFESEIASDTAALNILVANLLKAVPQVSMLRDPTRGGLSSSLNEIAQAANLSIEINEADLPISNGVQMACELLGLDPLYVANEGIMLVFVPQQFSQQALEVIRNSPYGSNASIIGEVIPKKGQPVYLQGIFGNTRVVEMVSGEQLPRIC